MPNVTLDWYKACSSDSNIQCDSNIQFSWEVPVLKIVSKKKHWNL